MKENISCLSNQTEPNEIELNMASWDPNFFNISTFFRVRFDQALVLYFIELNLMLYLMHSNEFGLIFQENSVSFHVKGAIFNFLN
jgi:hypothetical protein